MSEIVKRKSFLPDAYQVPDKARQFMKLKVGDNLLRILSAPALGWMVFTEEGKPFRRNIDEGEFTSEELAELKAKRNSNGVFETPKHFWLMLVWDYQDEAPKILDLTQISIIKPLYGLVNDEDWGDLRNYEINIRREGTGKNDTSFEVIPKPPKKLSDKIQKVLTELEENNLIDLDAIWDGGYPIENYRW